MKNLIKKHGLFIVFFVLILTLFSFLVFKQENILKTGDIVVLKTRPVDPRDLLRGEYVILRYEIEEGSLVEDFLNNNPVSESEIFVKLTEDEGVYIVDSLSETFVKDDGLWIKAVVGRYGDVRYPSIEQYYVPEGAGLPIERLDSDIYVEVALKKGEARIVRLLDENFRVIDPVDYLE